MLQKKISMLGGFAFGKTSLVKPYVESVFSETYLTTVGVKIDKKTVDLGDHAVSLIPWDVAGEGDISSLRMSYLQGRAGADGTHLSTLEVAPSLRKRIEADHGHLPFELLLLRQAAWSVRSSSARIGEGVEDAFKDLAVRVTAGQ